MAISTYKTYLMKGSGTSTISYTRLVDIKDFPDLRGAPDMLETTTLSDPIQTNILGIQTADALEFTANYTATDFAALIALEGTETPFAVYFGDNGDAGKFTFTGTLAVTKSGGGVNEVQEMVITIALSSAIEYSAQ